MKMEMPIEVAIRIRPRFSYDFLQENACIFAIPNSCEMLLPNQSTFMADYMFGPDKDQDELYEVCVKPLINLSLTGKDVSFIAFGAPTTGKSFTMFGNGVHFTCSESGYGVIPRVVRHIFSELMSKTSLCDFKVGMSITEMCDGHMRSVLGNCEISKDLPPVLQRGDVFICEDAAMGISFLHIAMTRKEQVSKLSKTASSEHHYIVTLHIFELVLLSGRRAVERFYKINMVDLASSYQTLPDDNGLSASSFPSIRFCNTSLITMLRLATLPYNSTNHINAVPDLLLFEVLRDICRGSVRSLVFCCLSPADVNYKQTLDYLYVVDQLRTLKQKYVHKLALSTFKPQQISTGECDINLNQRRPENEQNNSLVDENLLHLTPLVSNLESDSAPAYSLIQNGFDECIRPCENANLNQEEADDFGPQFAATQMKKLVSNAEDLLNHMLFQPDLPNDVKQEIDQWLYHKQEYDSCTTPESNSACEQNRTALEKIEEVTESDDEMCSSSNDNEEDNFLESSYSESGSGNESSFVEVKKDDPVFKPDFNDKLDNLMENFQRNFDKLVDNTFTSEKTEMDHNRPTLPRRGTVDKHGRRKSILPGDDPINLDILLAKDISPSCLPDVPESHSSTIILEETPRKLDDNIEHISNQLRQLSISDPKSFVLESLDNSKVVNDEMVVIDDKENTSDKEEGATALPYDELKILLMGSESKQNQLDLITLDLEGLRKRMAEIQGTIEIKEKFIAEMIKNTAIRTGAKARIEIKHNHLESEYFKARSHLALAEKALHEDKDAFHEHKVGKYKTIAEDFERRLHNIDMINQMTGDSAKKVLELESSLQQSKRKLQKLMKQAMKYVERKLTLEGELIEDQKKIKELDGKYKLTEKTKESKNKILTDEDDMEVDSPKSLQKMLKEANLTQDKNMSKDLMQVGSRINHLDQVMKEKCTSLEEEVDVQTKEAVSHEIRNLRRTRDCLDEQRFILVAKFNKDKVLSNGEERKFLECDEAIEAIDATIEYKNSLICGRGGSAIFSDRKNEEILLARLSKLSLPEMKSLLCKYFRKVIDLRENGRKMESQIAELDHTTETQQLKIQKLSNALQQTHLESERRMVVAQREHQEKLHLLYRHFADDSSGPSSSSSTSLEGYLRAQNKSLKQRLTELETRLLEYTDGSSTEVKCPRTTLVTRHKNKLIIQQQKTKKSSK